MAKKFSWTNPPGRLIGTEGQLLAGFLLNQPRGFIAALADEAGVSTDTVSGIRDGKTPPSLETLARLEKALVRRLKSDDRHTRNLHGFRPKDALGGDAVVRRTTINEILKAIDHLPGMYITLEADPGSGKSWMMAQLEHELKSTSVIASHNLHGPAATYYISQAQGLDSPQGCIGGLTHQISNTCLKTLPPDQNAVKNHQLASVIAQASQPQGPRTVVLIDAIDELEIDHLRGPHHPLWLPDRLPRKCSVVLASRPRHLALGAHKQIDLHATATNDARQLIRRSIEQAQEEREVRWTNSEVAQLIETYEEHSEGNFIYLHYVLKNLNTSPLDDVSRLDLPAGLNDFYEKQWKRIGKRVGIERRKEHMAIICRLALAGEPVSLASVVPSKNPMEVFDGKEILEEWGMFLRVHTKKDDGPLFSIYHWSFAEFLLDKLFGGTCYDTRDSQRLWLNR